MCLTGLLRRDLIPDCENDLDFSLQEDVSMHHANVEKTVSTVTEAEALKYIGGV